VLSEEPKFGCTEGFARQPNLEWASECEQIMEGTITGRSDYRTVSIKFVITSVRYRAKP
jgi:hypothetical protein